MGIPLMLGVGGDRSQGRGRGGGGSGRRLLGAVEQQVSLGLSDLFRAHGGNTLVVEAPPLVLVVSDVGEIMSRVRSIIRVSASVSLGWIV